MAAEERPVARARRVAGTLGLVAVSAACAAGALTLSRALEYRVALAALWGPGAVRVSVAVALVALGWSSAALAAELIALRRRAPHPDASLAPLDLALTLVLSWPLFLALVHPFERLWLELWLGPVSGAWAFVHLLSRERAALRDRIARWRRPAVAVSIVLVGGELALRALDALHPTPLTARVGDAPGRLVERFRLAPGTDRFGFRCNSLGHYDDEPPASEASEPWVAAIGDSFLVGAVPHEDLFTTVAERELGVVIQGFGVSGVGPPEYLWMTVEEALPRAPDAVLWCVFVGNDLDVVDIESERPHAWLRSFLDRGRVLWWQVPRRLARMLAEGSRPEPGPVGPAGPASPTGPVSAAAAPAPPEEVPTLPPETFLTLETRRARSVCAADGAEFAALRRSLPLALRAAGERPFGVVLIPDEFQVEDDLWAEVLRRAGEPLERDRPQRLLMRWLGSLGIPALDLLPVLRGAEPLEDGRRHVYHLRDTHWNARGNRLAGRALAPFVRELLGS